MTAAGTEPGEAGRVRLGPGGAVHHHDHHCAAGLPLPQRSDPSVPNAHKRAVHNARAD